MRSSKTTKPANNIWPHLAHCVSILVVCFAWNGCAASGKTDSFGSVNSAPTKRTLEHFKAMIKTMTAEDLIDNFETDATVATNTVEDRYYFAKNRAIEEELVERGSLAKDAILRHLKADTRYLYSGSRRQTSVRLVCRNLLERLHTIESGASIEGSWTYVLNPDPNLREEILSKWRSWNIPD